MKAPVHNYQSDLMEMLSVGVLDDLGPGTFRLLIIHEDACSYLEGGRCGCRPGYRIEEVRTDGKGEPKG